MLSKYPSKLGLTNLVERVKAKNAKLDGSGALMLYGPSESVGIADFEDVVKEIELFTKLKAKYLMANIVPAGVHVPVHTDTLKTENVYRYHLPIVTNLRALWWDERNKEFHMPLGVWIGPVPYYVNHSVHNRGPEERIHIVVDLV